MPATMGLGAPLHTRAPGGDLDPRTRAELERRGAANIRLLIANDMWVGVGEGAGVDIGGDSVPRPSRAQIEQWLKEQDEAEARLATHRHRQVLGWAIAATLCGAVGLIVSLAAWLWPAH